MYEFKVPAKVVVRKAKELRTLLYITNIKEKHKDLISCIKFLEYFSNAKTK